MKRHLSVLLILLLSLSLFTACGAPEEKPDGLTVVTTIFPVYDWVMNVLGDKAQDASVTMLLDSGVDLHSFQPTADDLVKISSCDLFVFVGGESDEWAEDAIKSLGGDTRVLRLTEVLGDALYIEETVEGMEAEEEEEPEYDEHIWLSLQNAAACCRAIAQKLGEADAPHAAAYTANAEAYAEKLSALDIQYADTVKNGSVKTLLFADRFPFRYLTEDYGLSYYAAFSGCSAESEASFETIAFLADRVSGLGLKTILTLEGSDGKIAQTVLNTSQTDAAIRAMDSMQSVTAEDVKAGASYLAIMEKNLAVLKEALA